MKENPLHSEGGKIIPRENINKEKRKNSSRIFQELNFAHHSSGKGKYPR
jgi:hypothetical protein